MVRYVARLRKAPPIPNTGIVANVYDIYTRPTSGKLAVKA